MYCTSSAWWWLKDHHSSWKSGSHPWFSNMNAQCIAAFLGLPTIFSKRDRSHCDFSCLLRLVVRGLIFLLSGRVSGPISLLSGRTSHHHLKRQYKMTLHMEGSNRHIKWWWLKDHFSKPRGQNPDILKHDCCMHCSLSRVFQLSAAKGIDLTVVSVACVSCQRPHSYSTVRKSIWPHISSDVVAKQNVM